MRRAALVRLTHGIHLRNRLNSEMNRSKANVDNMNGIASPAEYTEKFNANYKRRCCVKILASIGPIHGVQPAPLMNSS